MWIKCYASPSQPFELQTVTKVEVLTWTFLDNLLGLDPLAAYSYSVSPVMRGI